MLASLSAVQLECDILYLPQVLHDIDTSPSTRLEGRYFPNQIRLYSNFQNVEKSTSTTSDLALYVGVPLALGAAAAIGAQQILSRTRGT